MKKNILGYVGILIFFSTSLNAGSGGGGVGDKAFKNLTDKTQIERQIMVAVSNAFRKLQQDSNIKEKQARRYTHVLLGSKKLPNVKVF